MIQTASTAPLESSPRFWNPLERLRKSRIPKSIFFFTFHKCASSMFSEYALKHIRGLEHIDPDRRFCDGCSLDEVPLQSRGAVYGPLRLSTGPDAELHQKIIAPVIKPKFIRKRIALVLVRDPRDIAVSAYYSFGFSHKLSKVPEIRQRQIESQASIRAMTIDDYVLARMPVTLRGFAVAQNLLRDCRRGVLLRYEDMIHDWETFAAGLTRFADWEETVLETIHEKTRPREDEDITAHRRSGKTEGFREKLQPETIAKMNELLAPVLTQFGYKS